MKWRVNGLKDPREVAPAFSYSSLLQFTLQMTDTGMALKNKQVAANTSMQSLLKSQHSFLLVSESH